MGLSAVILAGGKGQRMGYVNKALLPFGGETLIERQIKRILPWTDEIIVVTNEARFASLLRSDYGVRVFPDHLVGQGPLAGLQAGLAAASGPLIWALACDQPFPSGEAAALLSGKLLATDGQASQAAVPIIEGKTQPLHAIYRKEVEPIARRLLQAGERRMTKLLEEIEFIPVFAEQFSSNDLLVDFSFDIDTPEQYDQLRTELNHSNLFGSR